MVVEPLGFLAALMRFVFCAIGSLGDVLPYLALAVALRDRGHEVVFGSNPRMFARVGACGIEFRALGTERDAQRTEEHPKLWHPMDGLGVLWRYLAVPALKPTYALIEEEVVGARDRGQSPPLVVCSPLALGARVAREMFEFRLCVAYTAPMNLRRLGNPMFLGARRVPDWTPDVVRRAVWSGLDAWKLHPMVSPSLGAWRNSLGLPEFRVSVFGQWMHDGDHRLALFPRWFMDARGEAPDVVQIEFPLWDEAVELSEATKAFLESASKPVVVYPGSGARWVRGFVEIALAAVCDAGAQALIVSPHRDEFASMLGAGVHHESQLPFSRLFERVLGVIHHGGIGTFAQATAAGCAQVILPSAFDQFENGWRLERLGLGRSVPGWSGARRSVGPRVSKALASALAIRRKGSRVSGSVDGAVCLESWARQCR